MINSKETQRFFSQTKFEIDKIEKKMSSMACKLQELELECNQKHELAGYLSKQLEGV